MTGLDAVARERGRRLRAVALHLGCRVPDLTADAIDAYLDRMEEENPGLADAVAFAEARRVSAGMRPVNDRPLHIVDRA